jgi:hypothetical protein
MSLAYHLFTALCDVTTQFERRRERYDPGSDAWVALTQLVAWLDMWIDALVETDGLAEEDTP